jgi:hypothetical protein
VLLINSALNNYTESLHILSGIRVCCSPLLHNKNSTYFVTGPIPNVKKIRGAPIERNRTRTHRLLECVRFLLSGSRRHFFVVIVVGALQ